MNILILNNGVLAKAGMSGSDRTTIHWSKLFSEEHTVFMMAPTFIKSRFPWANRFFGLEMKEGPLNVLDYVFYRPYLGIKKMREIKKSDEKIEVVYSSSDLVPDSVPAIALKLMSSDVKWISNLHLIAPSPFKGFNKIHKKGFHIPSFRELYYYFTQTIIMLFMRKLAQFVIVCNHIDKEKLIKKGFTNEQVLITHVAPEWNEINQIDTDKIDKQYDVCFIARFHPQKGYEDLFQAWAIISKQFKHAKLVMIGDIPTDILTKKLKQYGIDGSRVDFLGFVDGIEKYRKIAQSKVLLFPSSYESFGMVAVEGQACKVPVVAYNLAFFDTVYPKGMIRVDKVGDVKTLAEKVMLLLENEALRHQIAIEAYDNAKRFDFRYTAKDISRSLQNIVENSGGGGEKSIKKQ